MRIVLFALTLFALGAAPARADFSYTSTSEITGGMLRQMANSPVGGGTIRKALAPRESNVAIQGNKMATRSAESLSIIDLDAGTITNADFEKKTYTVTTFEQMREFMDRAMAAMNNQKPAQPAMKWTIEVKDTGRVKNVAGMDCREVILATKMRAADPQTGQSGEFVVNNVMMIAKAVPGGDELQRFTARMAEKMKFAQTMPEAGYAPPPGGGFAPAMAELQREARKLEGVPVAMLLTVGANADALPQSFEAAEAAAAQPAGAPQGARAAQPSIGEALGGALSGGLAGRLGGFGRKKKESEAAPAPAATPAPSAAPVPAPVLMQMKITDIAFSTAPVDPSIFAIPAGFKRVETERMNRR
jgi:hypothetical protein